MENQQFGEDPHELGISEDDYQILVALLRKIRLTPKFEEVIRRNLEDEAVPFEGGICLDEAIALAAITAQQ